jgi:acyl dehydratase
MSLSYDDVEFGADLPALQPDVTLANVQRFCRAANMVAGRFMSHEDAKKEGLPQAIVPGIMSQGILTALVHRWAPGCEVRSVDTVFRAPVLVDTRPTAKGAVVDKDDAARSVTLDLTVSNEAGETRVMGTAVVAFPR